MKEKSVLLVQVYAVSTRKINMVSPAAWTTINPCPRSAYDAVTTPTVYASTVVHAASKIAAIVLPAHFDERLVGTLHNPLAADIDP